MATSLASINSEPDKGNSLQTLEADDSEESFVVLTNSSTPDEPLTMQTVISSVYSVCPPLTMPPQETVVDQVLPSVNNSVMSTSASTTSELSPEEIQQKLENLLQENMKLREALDQNNSAMKKQYSTLVMWQEDVMKVHQSHKEKFEETKKLIANLRAENSELKKSNSLPTVNNDDIGNLKSKISVLEFELDTLRQASSKYRLEQTQIIQDLEIKLSECEKLKHDEIDKRNNQIESLNSQLQAVEREYNKIKEQLDETKKQVPTEAQIAEVNELRQQVKDLSAELLLKNKMLTEKTVLTDTFLEEISKLKIENETIPILKTQVDVYQSDFHQEREARNTLKSEKDRLAEDLRLLQRRNQKLLEQIEKMQTNAHQQSSARSTPVREQSPPLATFACPICRNSFRTIRLLEEHVETCLQNS